MPACSPQKRTKLAEEAGRIADITQASLLTGDNTYAFERIKETAYDPTLGENPRGIIFHNVPPLRTAYKPMVANGSENTTVTNPITGADMTVVGDKIGRLLGSGERIEHGYEERTRCLLGKPWTAGPYNLFDLMHKKAVAPWIESLRRDIPRFAREEFHKELLDIVAASARYKYSSTNDVARSANQNYFPCKPAGGASIEIFQHASNLAMQSGWGSNGKGQSQKGGAPMFDVYLGREDINWAVRSYRANLGVTLFGGVSSSENRFVQDKNFGEVQVEGGIKLINAKLPRRGVLLPNSAGGFVIEEISPYSVQPGVEGLILRENPEFTAGTVLRNGVRTEVVGIGYSIDPDAMERQAFSGPSSQGTGATPHMSNFDVRLLPEWDPVYEGANTDGWLFAYRCSHMFAPYIMRPELMTAFVFLAATPQVVVANPNSNAAAYTAAPITLLPAAQARPDAFAPCADTTRTPDATKPDCTTLYPANGVGVVQFSAQLTRVEEGNTITLVVERAGGSTGAATVAYATSNGTATSGTDYTAASGTLSWAAGEIGVKTFNVATISTGGDDSGKTITVTLSGVTGATLGSYSVLTLALNDADAA